MARRTKRIRTDKKTKLTYVEKNGRKVFQPTQRRKISSQRKVDSARQAHRRKLGGRILDVDYEPRPGVRLVASQRITGTEAKKRMVMFANKALEILRRNINSQMQGRWPKKTWGKNAGGPALLHTEHHWRVFQNHPKQVSIRPVKSAVAMWRGHTKGMTIYPKNRKWLHWREDGVNIFLKRVRLPRRDPRPTKSQLARIRIGE